LGRIAAPAGLEPLAGESVGGRGGAADRLLRRRARIGIVGISDQERDARAITLLGRDRTCGPRRHEGQQDDENRSLFHLRVPRPDQLRLTALPPIPVRAELLVLLLLLPWLPATIEETAHIGECHVHTWLTRQVPR